MPKFAVAFLGDILLMFIKKKYKDRNIFRSFSKNGYIWGSLVFTVMIFTIIYILDSSNLDNCYFINKNLY